MDATECYEVYAIRYATLARKASENFIGGDPHEQGSAVDYYVWLAKSPSRTFVIDTGFDRHVAERRGRKMLLSPEIGLGRLGVDAAEIREVIITHLHYDHVGNFAMFPKAIFHLQDKEMQYATGRHMAQSVFSHPYEVDEVVGMVRRLYEGKVRFHNGDAVLAPGLSVHHIGGHTQGIQSVRVHTRVGWIVLASDALHLYANRDQMRPFPIVHDVGAMLEGYLKLSELADDPRYVVPGHDPLVMQRYPVAGPGLDGVAVRLDAEPRWSPG